MKEQLAIRQLLTEEMIRLKNRNPAFSLRAFSRRAGVHPSAMSELLNGRRNFTKRMAQKILQRLCVDPERTEDLVRGLRDWGTGQVPVKRNYVPMELDQYHMVSDWYHYAILSLAETKDFDSRPEKIAQRLGITVAEVKSALERILRLGLLRREPGGRLVATGAQMTTSNDVVNLSIRKFHHQSLDLARKSLDEDPVDLRDFSAMTMAIDPNKIPQAKKMIRDFRRRLSDFLEHGEQREVYQICLQLFPLSKGVRK